MRAHSNFVENTAFVLILLALVELGFGSSIWLWGVGALYLVGRILHALGMDGMLWGRMVGPIVPMLTQLALALGDIGRESCRERVFRTVENPVFAATFTIQN